ncbi:probable transcription factor At5g61620 [Punica granatum]|uniref:Probable transcription factor At5g61620 n=1 Tax=Punica granatum TaxID=22663 RepID=A0A6P8CIY0_PUNGR|nr:probable transcription factor At5g61620 [Punica granatum]
MVKDSAWKCSQCGGNGHNSRTCNSKSAGCSTIKLFGVTIAETSHAPMKKSFSMDNLISSSNLDTTTTHHFDVDEAGYLSDGPIHSSKRAKSSHARKRGKPWTEEEHRTFLAGLKKLGKGNWRAISKKFVTTKTPTQVASHAQKYFLRQTSQDKKKRRSSLFDMRFEEPRPAPQDLLCISPSDEKPEIASKPQAR